jgi:cytochrome bd-type quinol oxidase subunit 2
MRLRQRSANDVDHKGAMERLHSTGRDLDRKYWVALALYAVLAGLAWFTMGEGKVTVWGRPVDMRLVPLLVIGGLALRTVLARHAERIRRGGDRGANDEGGNQAPGS